MFCQTEPLKGHLVDHREGNKIFKITNNKEKVYHIYRGAVILIFYHLEKARKWAGEHVNV